MDEEKLREFASQLEADTDALMDRWHQRPDRIIDDIFRVTDIDTGQPRELELFDVQRKVVDAYFYSDAGTINCYKGRRIGYSFAVIVSFLLEGIFIPNSFYPIVSRSLSQSKNRIDDLQRLIDNAKVEIPTVTENTDEIELWNGTTFMAYSSESDTSRGDDSARAVLMDEMAFMENEKEAKRAFGAFLALGQNRKMVEISTPNTQNDLFMQEHREGTEDGDNGILSIKQPTFANADDIDVHTSLYEQRLEPVRPEVNIDQLESERKADPEGFGQEYLCRPVVDEYRFFDQDSIVDSMGADYETGLDAPKPHGAYRVMGVDIGINRDDTVISVTDILRGQRKQRALLVVDDELLREFGIPNPDRGNVNDIADLINQVDARMDPDTIIMDQGGVGKTFPKVVSRKLGRKVVNFDFSAKDDVADMMGDTNAGLRDGDVALIPNDRLLDELSSIVKEKRDHYARPKFTGKDHSESGKDDTAMATVLSLYPPSQNAEGPAAPSTKDSGSVDASNTKPTSTQQKADGQRRPSYGSTSVSRSTRTRRNRYESTSTRRR